MQIKPFETFYVQSFEIDWETYILKFYYRFDNCDPFCERIDFSAHASKVRNSIDQDIVQTIIASAHIAFGVSYYKAYPTKHIVIENQILDTTQARYRKNFYRTSLSEFFYTNKIDPDILSMVISTGTISYTSHTISLQERWLIPLWWWKDSCVTIELAKAHDFPFAMFSFWQKYQRHWLVAQKNTQDWIYTIRHIDPQLFDMNTAWYYNWHVSITWLISFISLFFAYIFDYRYILLSNEHSANYWNVLWSKEINHQYNKSYQAEKDFRDFYMQYISPDIEYFSLLRPLYEIDIAKIFAQYTQYFDVFSSCNANFFITKNKTEKRCCVCPKCLFVFIILHAWLSPKDMEKIFWKNLFDDISLLWLSHELLWRSGIKPFECVWTPEETAFWIQESLIKRYSPNNLPPLLEAIVSDNKREDTNTMYKKKGEDIHHCIPHPFYMRIEKFC